VSSMLREGGGTAWRSGPACRGSPRRFGTITGQIRMVPRAIMPELPSPSCPFYRPALSLSPPCPRVPNRRPGERANRRAGELGEDMGGVLGCRSGAEAGPRAAYRRAGELGEDLGGWERPRLHAPEALAEVRPARSILGLPKSITCPQASGA
jgi:hypothetical protein